MKRKINLKIILILYFIILFDSCYLMTPAIKDHHYTLIKTSFDGNDFFKLSVTCSSNNKLFLFENNSNEKLDSIILCNSAFKKNGRFKFNLDTVYKRHYLLNLKINDSKFHQRIKEDTIKIKCFNNNSVEELIFIYKKQKI